MTLKYLIYGCIGVESVFDSQVLELINSINEKKIFKKVYLLLGIRNEFEMVEFRKRKLPDDIGIIIFRTYPNYAFFTPLTRWNLYKVLKKISFELEGTIFHIREEILAWHIKKIVNIKYHNQILPDIRGANLEEIKENHSLGIFRRYSKIWNVKRALNDLRAYNKITVVSAALKEYLIKKIGLNQNSILVTPDLAGKNFRYNPTDRQQIRKNLKIKDNEILILFSSGHTSEWQNWQNINALIVLAEKGIQVLNLSKHKVQHKNIINAFVKYSDMPHYLNAADISIMWSDKRIVTEVRSPVKFSEYICCGLPIIANDSVDMITDYIEKSQFGLLLDNLNELDQNKIKILLSMNRQEIANKGLEWLGVENISQKYFSIYSSL